MKDNAPSPQINVSKIAGGGGIAGAIFAVGSMAIFLIGIPALRYMFPAAILLGCGVALVLRFIRHDTPGASWILSAAEKGTAAPSKLERKSTPKHSTKIFLDSATSLRSGPTDSAHYWITAAALK
jgi:hypothetical protein